MCGGVMPFANLYAVETHKNILRDPMIYERKLLKTKEIYLVVPAAVYFTLILQVSLMYV